MNCVRVHVITHVCKSLFVFTPVAERTAENIPAHAVTYVTCVRDFQHSRAASHIHLTSLQRNHTSRSAVLLDSTTVADSLRAGLGRRSCHLRWGVCMQHNGAGETRTESRLRFPLAQQLRSKWQHPGWGGSRRRGGRSLLSREWWWCFRLRVTLRSRGMLCRARTAGKRSIASQPNLSITLI